LLPSVHNTRLELVICIANETWTKLFNSVYFVQPNITNSPQRALQPVHIQHPWPLTSHRITNNSQKIEKNLSGGKINAYIFTEGNENWQVSWWIWYLCSYFSVVRVVFGAFQNRFLFIVAHAVLFNWLWNIIILFSDYHITGKTCGPRQVDGT